MTHYCKTSCDDFLSNVHVTGDGYTYTIMVALNKHEFKKPLPPRLDDNAAKEDIDDRTKQVLSCLGKIVPLDNKLAGESYVVKTRAACLEKLNELRAAGLHVPQHAIDRLHNEIALGVTKDETLFTRTTIC